MSFASSPERAIIASSLSSRAAAGSPSAKPAAREIWVVIGKKASLTWCGEHW